MGLIFNTRKIVKKDYSKMNHLSPEMKLLIVNAQSEVDQAKNVSKEKCYDFDLTAKTQLRDDWRAVEKKIQDIEKKGVTDTSYQELEILVLRLQTTLQGLLNFF